MRAAVASATATASTASTAAATTASAACASASAACEVEKAGGQALQLRHGTAGAWQAYVEEVAGVVQVGLGVGQACRQRPGGAGQALQECKTGADWKRNWSQHNICDSGCAWHSYSELDKLVRTTQMPAGKQHCKRRWRRAGDGRTLDDGLVRAARVRAVLLQIVVDLHLAGSDEVDAVQRVTRVDDLRPVHRGGRGKRFMALVRKRMKIRQYGTSKQGHAMLVVADLGTRNRVAVKHYRPPAMDADVLVTRLT